MDIQQAFKYAVNEFKKINIDSAEIDAIILLEYTLKKPRTYICSNSSSKITSPLTQQKFLELVARRATKEPIAYIIKEKEFYGHNFFVDKNVLIPRPDSELLIDITLQKYKESNPPLKILELGIGSGCILLTLLLELSNARGLGVDISPSALKVATKNIKLHQLEHRIDLKKSDWFKDIPEQKFNLIISNPPYVGYDEVGIMADETVLYEPKLALFAGQNGLEVYQTIATTAKNYLNDNGLLIVEINSLKLDEVINIFKYYNYKVDGHFKDWKQRDRAIIFTYEG